MISCFKLQDITPGTERVPYKLIAIFYRIYCFVIENSQWNATHLMCLRFEELYVGDITEKFIYQLINVIKCSYNETKKFCVMLISSTDHA